MTHYIPIFAAVLALSLCIFAIVGYLRYEPVSLRPAIEIPKNKWMNSTVFLAQAGHSLGGYAIVTTLAFHGGSWRVTVIVGAAVAVLAAAKEFLYDANYEIPHQTFWDNFLDFSFWCLGAAVGVLGVWVRAV